jgi:hypothetical protein
LAFPRSRNEPTIGHDKIRYIQKNKSMLASQLELTSVVTIAAQANSKVEELRVDMADMKIERGISPRDASQVG